MLLFGLKKQNNENLSDITFKCIIKKYIFSKNPVMVIEGFFFVRFGIKFSLKSITILLLIEHL